MTPEPAEKPSIPRPVWFLGWTSLFTDAATEIIYPLLPVYLSRVLGAGALSLGIIEGVAEGVNSLLKVVSGYWADRSTRRRPIVIGGYALSSLARPLIRALDRVGKGIRGAPRDVLLAKFATPGTRGRIFGFHNAMDHTGAIVGPLAATVFLFFLPNQYRLLFGLTLIPGAIAVALLFFVDEDAGVGGEELTPNSRIPNAESQVASPKSQSGKLPARVIALLGVLLVFGLGNSADAFLLLRLSDALGGATFVPLLWAAIHVVKASLSTWGGGLSDRYGRQPMLIAGLLFYGVYFALAEGAEKALIADLTPSDRRGAAFGWYNATIGIGALIASVLFGELYEHFGARTAFMTGAALAGLATVLLLFIRTDRMKDSDARHSGHQ